MNPASFTLNVDASTSKGPYGFQKFHKHFCVKCSIPQNQLLVDEKISLPIFHTRNVEGRQGKDMKFPPKQYMVHLLLSNSASQVSYRKDIQLHKPMQQSKTICPHY